ncbi:hypothetical protein ScPMuIL_013063 [Solemya velum]
MGTGTSTPAVGVSANPRLVYTDKLSKKERRCNLLLDVPVLVDVQHGSIRYRPGDEDGEPKINPGASKDLMKVTREKTQAGYFFHTRLNDFTGSKFRTQENESHKFTYVAQGPASAKQKKIFYVYGFGMEKQDGARTLPTTTDAKGDDYSWPVRRKTSDVFYDLFKELKDKKEEMGDVHKESPIATRLRAIDSDTVGDVRRKLASLVQHAASDITICFNKRKLDDDTLIVDLREGGDGN